MMVGAWVDRVDNASTGGEQNSDLECRTLPDWEGG
jgi:hypothetical protein